MGMESERVQKGLEAAREQAARVAESETVKQGVEYAKVGAERAKEGAAQLGAVGAKGAGVAQQVWSNGRGELKRAQEAVKSGAWRGSAKETLDMGQREEEWAKFKVKGCEEVTVAARSEYTTGYQLQEGWTIQWTFRVKALDVQFCLRQRVMADGGSVEEVILPLEKCFD